jgi:hypothetical protein
MANTITKEKLRPRQVLVRGEKRRARIPRRVGLDVTARPGEAWPRNAIAAEGEELELTHYIKNLIRCGDLERVESKVEAKLAPNSKD